MSALSIALLDADARPGRELAVVTESDQPQDGGVSQDGGASQDGGVSQDGGGGVSLFLFDGRTVKQRIPVVGTSTAQKVRAGDINGDGVDDLAVSDGQSIQVLFGKPQRTVGH